jgi:ankyrin repeat protein
MGKLLTILVLMVFSLACAPRSDETTPEMAQNLLKIRGFNYTEGDFFKAIRQADAPAVKLFLQAGINPNARNSQGETALTVAAAYSDVATVRHLAEKADVNERDGQGSMPLFVALKRQRDEIFDFLLEKGADPNSDGTSVNAKNQSVLYVAILRNKMNVVVKLLDKGADPNRTDDARTLPLYEIVVSYAPNMLIFERLLEKTTDVNLQDSDRATLLIYAVKNPRVNDAVRREMIKSLMEKGADPNLKDRFGKSALDYAKERKTAEIVEMLK